jgi:hypothetical protein
MGPPKPTFRRGTQVDKARKEVAEEAWAVTGWRIFYQIAIEEGWFSGKKSWFTLAQLSEHENAFYAEFETFVSFVTLKMARV